MIFRDSLALERYRPKSLERHKRFTTLPVPHLFILPERHLCEMIPPTTPLEFSPPPLRMSPGPQMILPERARQVCFLLLLPSFEMTLWDTVKPASMEALITVLHESASPGFTKGNI